MADNNENGGGAGGNVEDGKDAPQPARAENLDALHEEINNRHGEEFGKPQDEEDADDKKEKEDEEPAKSDDEEDPIDGKEDDPKDKKEEPEKEEPVEEDEPAAKDDDTADLTPPENDDDVTKPGKYKALFVDDEGNKYYVSDVKQLPDDFEPQSQRNYGIALQDLGEKRGDYKADVAKYEEDKVVHDRTLAAKTLQENWKSDIERLTEEKTLPEDPTERDKVIKGVYSLMSAELKKGKSIDSWETAHELYQAREAKKQAAEQNNEEVERKKAEAAEKKKQGGKVMGGGAPEAPKKSAGGTKKAPPVGTSLDALHQSKVGSL